MDPISRRSNDRVLYLGFNHASADAEAAALGPNVKKLVAQDSPLVDDFDVTTSDGVHGFVEDLGAKYNLSVKQQEDLQTVLLGAPASGRDELARIAMEWAPAENGADVPSRLVLSGHSSIGMLWGDNDVGMIHLSSVRDLGRIFKSAAAQIEDIHISGCFSEREVQGASDWTAAFPNMKTIWGYGAFAPHAPTQDLHDWELATRGRTSRLSEGFVANHGSATAWSIAGGIAHATSSVEERRQLVAEADTRFDAYFSGEKPIANPHDPAADKDYGAYQMLASHAEATPAERTNERGTQMLRLRFWESSVRNEVATHHGQAINAAFTKAGLDPIDFATLSRKDALAAIDKYRETTGALGPILSGIAALSPTIIPASWCH
jgi:hypothetical protein